MTVSLHRSGTVSVAEAAAMLGMTERDIFTHVASGGLRPHPIYARRPDRPRFATAEVLRFKAFGAEDVSAA